jgi:biopolymer transport protein ExbB/TolQ
MTAVDQLRSIFHAVAGVLMWPVLLGLLGLAAAMLVALGMFAREAWDRSRGRQRALDADRAELAAVPVTLDADEQALGIEEVLQRCERRRWRSLNRLRLAVRVGPSLGLMGTLIPMADALQGLADGNLPALASNMVTAFAATVIGLTISVVAYLVSAARENWVRTDAAALAFDAERLHRSSASAAVSVPAGVPTAPSSATVPATPAIA